MRPNPRFRILIFVTVLWSGMFFSNPVAMAQRADGFTLQETPGLALVKPQPWSKRNEATVREFEAFIDRTSTGANSGYYEFYSDGGHKRQIPAGRVVKVVVYPDPARIQSILGPQDLEKIRAAIAEINEVIAAFPATKVQLTPSVKVLDGELKKFESGQIKADGTWIPRQEYFRTQSAKLARLLKAEIANADPPDSFDLKVDPKYVALVEYAKSDPSLKPLVHEILADYTQRVRVEKRRNLLDALANPKISFTDAEAAVKKLRTLKPEEDPASAAYLKSWDAAQSTVESANATADQLAAKLEEEMAAVTADTLPPQLSPALASGLGDLNRSLMVFRATTPPAPLLAEAEKALAVAAVGESLRKWATLSGQSQYLQAQDVLSEISDAVIQVGPETARVVGAMQKVNTSKIDQFTRLRQQAKLLADSGKAAEALTIYEQAYEVIPDSTVSTEIEKLKKKVPPAK